MSTSTVSHNSQRRLGVRVAEHMAALRHSDPELHALLNDYITSLRFESARNRARVRELREALEPGVGAPNDD